MRMDGIAEEDFLYIRMHFFTFYLVSFIFVFLYDPKLIICHYISSRREYLMSLKISCWAGEFFLEKNVTACDGVRGATFSPSQ